MAKYEDYAKADPIAEEIEQASSNSQQRESHLPPQFEGKSAEDIARSYEELQRMSDRQANELGDLRKTTANLTNLLQSSPEPEQHVPVTVDDLYLDPEQAINKIVDERVSGKLNELEQTQRAILANEEMKLLEGKFPNYKEEARSSEMQEWLKESGYRQRLAASADKGDIQAAEDLFSMYYDLKGTAGKPDGDDYQQRAPAPDVRGASLETGKTDMYSPVEKFSRSKLELARIRAKRGDREAQQYLTENKDAIYQAYEEGRIVN